MVIVICADKNGGILFNNRRQSRDSKLIEDLAAFAGNRKILASPYSEKLLANVSTLQICENYLDAAEENDICFAEREDVSGYLYKANTLIVYRWNKVYPADRFLNPTEFGFRLKSKTDFPGSSHDSIDREVYVR
ncbi:MAG: ribonuclease Z [Clostridia bacterium]|nr:ribonuclease Z [Clostridia bacterium]